MDFVKPDRNSYRYDLTGFEVAGANGRSYTPEEINAGATFNFVDPDYVIFIYYDNPRPVNAIVVENDGNGTGSAGPNPAAEGETVTLQQYLTAVSDFSGGWWWTAERSSLLPQARRRAS